MCAYAGVCTYPSAVLCSSIVSMLLLYFFFLSLPCVLCLLLWYHSSMYMCCSSMVCCKSCVWLARLFKRPRDRECACTYLWSREFRDAEQSL